MPQPARRTKTDPAPDRTPDASDYTARHTVPQAPLARQIHSPMLHAGRLGIAVFSDKRLRASALGISVLAALIVYGAADHSASVDLHIVAADLGSSYNAVYKSLSRLAQLGYVVVSREKLGRRRLSMRVTWPERDPAGQTEG